MKDYAAIHAAVDKIVDRLDGADPSAADVPVALWPVVRSAQALRAATVDLLDATDSVEDLIHAWAEPVETHQPDMRPDGYCHRILADPAGAQHYCWAPLDDPAHRTES